MIHVAIDARLPDHGQGGVQQVIRSIAEGFRLAGNSDIRRSWIVFDGTNWWKGVLPLEDNLIFVKPPYGYFSIWIANRMPKLVSRIYPLLSKINSRRLPFDNKLNDLKVDVVHLPFQDGFRTTVPYLYNPHDFQHEYLPENFTKTQIKHRNTYWKTLCRNAELVIAATPLVKEDLIQFWKINAERIRIIPIPSPTRHISSSQTTDYSELQYFLYPAVFWPHKNHAVLIQAMKILVAKFPHTHLVLAGASGHEEKRVKRLVKSLGLRNNVHFAGHVPESQFGTLINQSICIVIPSLFEARSLVVADAQNFGKPVLCSDLPYFKFHGESGVTFFDPSDAQDLAEKMICSLNNVQKVAAPNHQLSMKQDINLFKFASDLSEAYKYALDQSVTLT